MVILLLVQLCVIYGHVGGSAGDQGGENQQSKLCRLSTEGLTTCSTFDRWYTNGGGVGGGCGDGSGGDPVEEEPALPV